MDFIMETSIFDIPIDGRAQLITKETFMTDEQIESLRCDVDYWHRRLMRGKELKNKRNQIGVNERVSFTI